MELPETRVRLASDPSFTILIALDHGTVRLDVDRVNRLTEEIFKRGLDVDGHDVVDLVALGLALRIPLPPKPKDP